MIWLLAGLAVFFGVHLIPSCPRSRENLIQRLGEWPYKGMFAVLSVIGLVLIITGMGRAERIVIWHPPAVAGLATAVAMAPALILLVAANFNGHIKRIVRHPMSLGVLLWSVSHLVANGELASLFLFGGLRGFCGIRYVSVQDRLIQPAGRRRAGQVGLAHKGFSRRCHWIDRLCVVGRVSRCPVRCSSLFVGVSDTAAVTHSSNH